MTKELMISMLRKGTDGDSILQILDAICSDVPSHEDNEPTLDPISF